MFAPYLLLSLICITVSQLWGFYIQSINLIDLWNGESCYYQEKMEKK